MKTKISNCLLLLLLLSVSGIITESLFAQDKSISKLPSQILFNGYLTDKEGNHFSNSNYTFTIYIYDSPTAQTPIWSERHENVIVKEGAFTLAVGSKDQNNLRFDKKYYLGIKINEEDEMPQRLEFGSTAYSLGSKYANSVSDASITTEKLVNNSVTDDKIRNFSLSKITDLPSSIGTLDNLKSIYKVTGSDYEWWTTFGNFIYGPERHFLGTRNERDFVIQTYEIQRMRFDAHGYIVLGTISNPVDFEVFGFSTFDYLFITGNLGVGVDPALAKMHINSPLHKNPLRIDYQSNPIFTIDTLGRVEITSSVSGSDSDIDNYPVVVSAEDQGIGIDIEGKADGSNNYVSFWDDDGMAGRIEGQTAADYASEPMSIATDAFLAALIVAEGVAATSFLYPLPIPTEPADIIRIAADIAEMSFGITWDYTHLGITYESGSGDYAEWLERSEPNEVMSSGDIVAVNGGKITKNTVGAGQLMAVSTSPIILGNMPPKGNEDCFEKIAFMGQIPIKVRGIVNNGDFIIPSGLNDGIGIAVAPELMTIDELDKVVGRAWSSSSNNDLKMINVLVGVNTTDIGQMLESGKLETVSAKNKIYNVQNSVSEIKAKLESLKNSIFQLNSEVGNAIKVRK